MMKFNFKKFIYIFLFFLLNFRISVYSKVLSDYCFDNFNKLNKYLDNSIKNEIFKTEFFQNFTEKVLDDSLNVFIKDLYNPSLWFKDEVPFSINVKKSVFKFFKDLKTEDIYSASIDEYFGGIDYSFFVSKSRIDEIDGVQNFIVIGDLHGNYSDFIFIIKKLMSKGVLDDQLKLRKNNKIIFLGDIVDRGDKSLELILFIFLLKILNEESVVILRGNHESFAISCEYGFGKELYTKSINYKFFTKLYGKILSLFDLLPEAHCFKIFEKNFLFSHGGWNNEFDFEIFLKDIEHNYFESFCTSKEFYLSPFLWNDISPFVSKIKKVPYRGFCYPAKYITDLMDHYKIETLFKGHDHEMPKKIEFKNKILRESDLKKPTSGFCELEKNRIFLIISTSIHYPEGDIIYGPTYAHLKVDESGYSCSGIVCE